MSLTQKLGKLAVFVQALVRVRAKITSQSWRPDLGQIRPIGNRKTAVIAGLFRGFYDFRSVEDGRKMGCENVKLFLREPKVRSDIKWEVKGRVDLKLESQELCMV